jgi:hypothetical protein
VVQAIAATLFFKFGLKACWALICFDELQFMLAVIVVFRAPNCSW